MPENPVDLHTPLPDEAHERLRTAVVEALDGIAAQVQRVEDVLLVLQATTDLGQSTVTTGRGAQGSRALVARLAELEQRVAAVENGAPQRAAKA